MRVHSIWIWAVALLFYVFTLAPGMGLGDVALLVDTIREFRLSTHVNNHPMTVLMGALFAQLPFQDVVYGLNLLSAVIGSLSVYVFYLALRETLYKPLAVFIATIVMMTSHSMWWHSTVLENYCFNALAVSAYLYFAAKLHYQQSSKYLFALFFVSSLALFNHVQMSFLSVGAGFALLRRISRNPQGAFRYTLICTLVYLLGLMPWLTLFLYDVSQSGDFLLTLRSAFFGSFEHIMLQGTWEYAIRETSILFLLQTPHFFLLCLVAGPIFFFREWRFSAAFIAVIVVFLLNTYFFMFYNTWDRFAFLLPSFIIAIFMGAFALDWLIVRLRPLPRWYRRPFYAGLFVLCALSPVVYYRLVEWGSSPGGLLYPRYINTYTENTHRGNFFIANPNKRNFYDVDLYLQRLFEKLPQGAVYIDDDSRLYYPANVYQKYYRLRPDVLVTMMNSWGIDGWGMSGDQLKRALQVAYYTDKPLFLVSLLHPFQQVLKGTGFQFKKFPLDNTRWIYQLMTRKDYLSQLIPIPEEAIELKLDFRSDITHAARGFSHNLFSSDQEMSGFGKGWLNANHLFARPLSEDLAFIELLVNPLETGIYVVELKLTAAPDYGRIRVMLGEDVLFGELDLYSPRVVSKVVRSYPVSVKSGYQSLKIVSLGKSKESDGFAFGLDAVTLRTPSLSLTQLPEIKREKRLKHFIPDA